MSSEKPIFILESNDFAAKKLRQGLAVYTKGLGIEVIGDELDKADSALIETTKPIRLGKIIDQIHYLRSAAGHNNDVIDIAGCSFDTRRSLFLSADGEPVRLTEKEVALLVLLYKAQGDSVSREDLLEQIWDYAENVETHTAETHIYRLRQKIEDDPANPRILKTSDQGYYLSFE